ncbi:hypothetical protein GUJ93_ZPchr0002g26556 [Zizania palustris]|uniref:Uncharacterized protein n=1 Tax=Zizania palustris TaxID=103762 RepID=A0A8J5VFQ5_ZIZPA|nr:hypothetical protein GUJ93_ZPchr0002g26556 [Zizania palustris]
MRPKAPNPKAQLPCLDPSPIGVTRVRSADLALAPAPVPAPAPSLPRRAAPLAGEQARIASAPSTRIQDPAIALLDASPLD